MNCSKRTYPVLERLIFENDIKKKKIANSLGVSPRTFTSKLHGISKFTWNETCIIQKEFFPDMDKDTLFSTIDEKEAG